MFQSTRPRGARPSILSNNSIISSVSIHAPARGATYPLIYIHTPDNVSIHAPARGATQTVAVLKIILRFQSTRPRGARPCIIFIFLSANYVSIHAPARGATLRKARAARRGCFNPRARAGRDDVNNVKAYGFAVSIHAPARGATYFLPEPQQPKRVSIHAPARGATRSMYPLYPI